MRCHPCRYDEQNTFLPISNWGFVPMIMLGTLGKSNRSTATNILYIIIAKYLVYILFAPLTGLFISE